MPLTVPMLLFLLSNPMRMSLKLKQHFISTCLQLFKSPHMHPRFSLYCDNKMCWWSETLLNTSRKVTELFVKICLLGNRLWSLAERTETAWANLLTFEKHGGLVMMMTPFEGQTFSWLNKTLGNSKMMSEHKTRLLCGSGKPHVAAMQATNQQSSVISQLVVIVS